MLTPGPASDKMRTMPWTSCGRLLAALTAVVATAACASSSGGPTPYPFPSPTARRGGVLPPGTTRPDTPADTPGTPASLPTSAAGAPALARAVATRALDYVGTPYRLGGNDPNGFDCSGLTRYVFQEQGIALPRTVAEQFGIGRKVDVDEVRAGDLLFFATSGRGASHVAIALGDGWFVHAPSSRGGVRVEALSGRYWSTRLLGARRIIR